MLTHNLTPREVLDMIPLKERALQIYAEMMSERIPTFAPKTTKGRRYSRKEVEVLLYILRRKDNGLTIEAAMDEAMDIFYDTTERDRVLEEVKSLVNKLLET
ncbi:MerR family transcriptional regulator [Lysinibacillus sphaericus]|uniref:HTH merR-type domain-containing protein n=1 Tax=Lysinibacillus sphaericus OT4b.31 TaxID=1285586 RepID=R7ZJ60_LYSSH|nr:MerR family transcriptional regulator [Lysinibacillus sphaericus]EON74135.1 hypothetical protein H131_01598 [Lysinibacillus sphaericus OT4b.31]